MKRNSTFAAIIAALGLICLPITSSAQQSDVLPPRVTDFALTEAPDDHVMGDEAAALTLIIWASVTCPHCSSWFSNDWPIVKKELVETGKLRVIFREFPTAPGELSMAGFSLAECAPTQDYMSIIEYQMENQDEIFKAAQEGRGPEAYEKIAKLAGMETNEAMTTCLRNPDIAAHIVDNARRAELAEIKGVPAFLINGQHYKGASDAKSLVALINDLDSKGISTLPKTVAPADAHAGHDHD